MTTPPVFTVPIWFSSLGYCDPSLPCGNSIPLSCPCPTTVPTVPSVGKSGKSNSASLSGVCGNDIACGTDGVECTKKSCCGIDGYLPCWYMWYASGGLPPLGTSPNCGGAGLPACCGYGTFPPCESSPASVGKSGKSTSLATTTPTCGTVGNTINPPCCGFEFYPPCGFTLPAVGTGNQTNACGGGNLPPCANSLSSGGKSGKGYGSSGGSGYPFTGVSGSDIVPLTMAQLSAEVDGAVEEAVEKMVNIGELNVFEGEVNVYRYGDDGEADVVNIVASEGLN